MPFTPRRLPIQPLAFAAGLLTTRELPKTVYRGLHLLLTLNHTNASATGFTLDSFLNLLPRIDVVLDGQDVVASLSARDLQQMNRYDFSSEIPNTIVTTNGAQVSTFQLYLPFALTRGANPEDTLLDGRKVNFIGLSATWGSSVATSGVTIDSATLSIETDEYANVVSDLAVARHELSVVTQNLNQVGSIPINLEVRSNNQYRRLFLSTRNASGVLTSGLITNVRVRARSFDYLDCNAALLQSWNLQETALASLAGQYALSFTRDGRQTQRIDARDLSELVVEVESTVTDGTIRIIKDKSIFA